MGQDIRELLKRAGLEEDLHPGQRIVKKCPVAGEYKSHCVVYDWRDPARIRIEVKPGLTGKDLPPAELKKYPVAFQAPTWFDIPVTKKETARG